MDKKSRIKTTLDNLFTGSKTPADVKPPVSEKKQQPEKKPASPKAKPASEKPVEKKPVPTKPSMVPVETPAPIAATTPVEPAKLPEPAKEPVKSDEKPVEIPAVDVNPAPGPAITTQPVQSISSVPAVTPPAQGKDKMDEEKVLQLAQSINLAAQNQSQDEEHLVIFSLGKELYGVTIHAVESIIKLQAITQVPKTVAFILGVTNLRGTVVPVLDLRIRFNLPLNENTGNTRIVIVNSEGSKVGIVVDEVTEVLKVSRTTIQPPPPMSTTIESAFISGIARIDDRLVILLDLEKVLASSSRQHNR